MTPPKKSVKPSEAILFNVQTDPSLPRGYQAEPMDYINAIIKHLDEQHEAKEGV
jgi:hypothetical protein